MALFSRKDARMTPLHGNVFSSVILLCALFSPFASAWAGDGHKVTGMVAEHFLSPRATEFVHTFLDPELGGLPQAATYADGLKWSDPWSRKLHYVQAAPSDSTDSCSYSSGRDCADGKCLLGAVQNYTQILECESQASPKLKSDAIAFLAHYVGDMTQPLHLCKRLNGGNGAKATFNPRTPGRANTNLHVIWDKMIIQKRVREDFMRDLEGYSSHLVGLVSSTTKAKEIDLIRQQYHEHDDWNIWNVAIHWATETNGLNCDTVWEMYDQDSAQDLSGRYYQDVFETVDSLLAIAGFRIASLLNTLVESYNDDGSCVQ